MGKEIIIWYGMRHKLRKGQTIKNIDEKVKDGDLIFEPGYKKITDLRGKTLVKKTSCDYCV